MILVTGGTGNLGGLVVARLAAAGRPVRVLTRQPAATVPGADMVTGDLLAGTGLANAVEGVTAIVHCASAQKGDATATANLLRAALAGGQTPHVVYISIVGIDRVALGYYKSKVECELLVARSGLPWTTLRATQFYDLIVTGAAALSRLPVVPAPSRFPVRPVDAAEVADRMVELALADAGERVPDMAGPRATTFVDLVREYLQLTGRRRPVVPVWLPGIGAIRAGGLLPDDSALIGRRTFADFVTAREGGQGQSRSRSKG